LQALSIRFLIRTEQRRVCGANARDDAAVVPVLICGVKSRKVADLVAGDAVKPGRFNFRNETA
jgi:hypothetical protein